MTDFDQQATEGMGEEANQAMWELAVRLKRDFRLEQVVDEAIRKHDVALTSGALLMLVVPLVEAAVAQRYRRERQRFVDDRLDVTLAAVRRSLEDIVGEAAGDPAAIDRVPELRTGVDAQGRVYPMRSSQSIIKAQHKRWCRIPPFCGE